MAYQKIKGTGPVRAHFLGKWLKGYGRYMKFKHDLAITQANYIVSQRLQAIVLLEEHGFKAVQTAYGVSRPTVYRWRRRWISSGRWAEALTPQSTRPHKTRRMETDPRVVDFIRGFRRRYPRLGKAKLKPLLDEYCRKEGIPTLAEATIGKVIKRHHLNFPPQGKRGGALQKRYGKRKRVSSRVKAQVPGELVQIDAIVRFEDGIRFYLITAVDLFSRFSFAYAYRTLSSRAALDFYSKLERVAPFEIQAVKTDNGSEFLGEFDQHLKKKKITHYFSYPRTPKSNSFVERFNRTIQEEFVEYRLDLIDNLPEFNSHLIDYLLFFNGIRPHQALAQTAPLGYLVKNRLLSQMSVSHTFH